MASLILGSALLLVMALPVLSLRLGFSDESNYSEGTTTRRAYDLLVEGFGPGFNGPLIVTAEVSRAADRAALEPLVAALGSAPGVASVTGPLPSDRSDPSNSAAYLIQVVPTSSPQDEQTSTLVDELRDEVVPSAVAGTGLDVNITGTVAINMDFTDYLAQRIVIFFGAVLALSFLLLMVVFRSILVPIKAVTMNLLSIAAAYGIIVAVFQWGWFGTVLGIEEAPIEPFIPMMMFAIVFGLSMDYEIFLLSRVKEEFDRTGDAVGSVADGLASTARVITAAAAIMVVIFGSFVFEDDRIASLFGLGLAVAILLDATIVRMLLVPATMSLLGERNWWLPGWLQRTLPRISIERTPLPRARRGRGADPRVTSFGRSPARAHRRRYCPGDIGRRWTTRLVGQGRTRHCGIGSEVRGPGSVWRLFPQECVDSRRSRRSACVRVARVAARRSDASPRGGCQPEAAGP